MTATPALDIETDHRQRGAVLPLMAILLVVLVGIVAMAIDLGWLFWQSIEVQHGADASALAGVVYEPNLRTEAHSEATAAALQNGYDNSAATTTVTVVDYSDDPSQVENENQLRVTITHKVDTFFLKVFGLNDVDIKRTAVASYTPPLLMGSPDSTFGRDFSQYAPGDATDPGFWASISGTYGPASWGDRHASPCKDKVYIDGTDYGTGYGLIDHFNDPCITSDDYRPVANEGTSTATGGYIYAIEVPDGSSGLALEIFDGPMFAQDNYNANTADRWTGDYWPDPSSWSWYNPFGPPSLDVTSYFDTYFMLYGPDPTPLITSDNELLCVVRYSAYNDTGNHAGGRDTYYSNWDPLSEGWDRFTDVYSSSAGGPAYIDSMWDNMATSAEKQPGCAASFDRGPGLYPLRVVMQHDEPGGCPGEFPTGGCPYAFNKYSMRTSTTSGDQPTISGLTDMSVFTNDTFVDLDLWLAKVEPKYAGQDLTVEFFDVGDFGNSTSQPGDDVTISAGNGDTLSCSWVEEDLDGDTNATGSTCSFDMTLGGQDNRWDNRVIKFTIPIPDSYTCSGDACWFRVTFDYSGPGNVRDVSTWTAYISGNPIRIVE